MPKATRLVRDINTLGPPFEQALILRIGAALEVMEVSTRLHSEIGGRSFSVYI